MNEKITQIKIPQTIEVRAFGKLKKIFTARAWSFPIYYKKEKEITALKLAEELKLPLEEIEAVFINGRVSLLKAGVVQPGDRVAFIPPGTPGPYRVMLGIVKR